MSGIGDILETGAGFANPLSTAVTNATLQFGSVIGEFGTMVAGNALWNNPQDVIDAQSILLETKNNLTNFGVHTDRLAGVGGGEPSLASIAQVINTAKNATGELSCGSMNNAFGSILKGADLINTALDAVRDILSLIAQGPAILLAKLNKIKNDIVNQIQADLDAFQDAVIIAAREAFAGALVGLFGDSCFGAVLGQVASPLLTNALQAESNKLRGVIDGSISDADNALGNSLRDALPIVNIPQF